MHSRVHRTVAGPSHGSAAPAADFTRAPFLLVWEITRACALACGHCRAAAIDQRDLDELTTAEGHELLRQTAAMGTPVCVLTGGDPLQRPDLEELIREGTAAGNVREQPIAGIYRDNELFRALRDPERLRGRCGRCVFRTVCGGSRSRAFAISGDPLQSDPCCADRPGQMSAEALVALVG